MKHLKATLLIFLLLTGMSACQKDETGLSLDYSMGTDQPGLNSAGIAAKLPKATGSVEFLWKGAEKGSDMGNKPEALRAFFSFDAHEGYSITSPRGEIIYTVTYPDLSPHREIKAMVTGVAIEGTMAWITGIVISDTKGCAGDGHGGHESGCSSGSGGCGEETDEGHDGGCSDGGSEEGGCSGGGMDTGGSPGGESDGGGCSDGGTDGGGCSDSGTDEGGCSDSGSGEEGNGSDMGQGSPGGSMGNPLSGKNCRLGQVIAIKMHDKGTPGIYDGLSWKWFSPSGAFVPSIENHGSWGQPNNQGLVKLCKKTIVEGNLVVHN